MIKRSSPTYSRGLAGVEVFRTYLVVAHREVEQAIGTKGDGSRLVDALNRIGSYLEQYLLGRGVDLAILEDETPQVVLVMRLVPFHRHSVLQIDPVVLVEVRVQGDAD